MRRKPPSTHKPPRKSAKKKRASRSSKGRNIFGFQVDDLPFGLDEDGVRDILNGIFGLGPQAQEQQQQQGFSPDEYIAIPPDRINHPTTLGQYAANLSGMGLPCRVPAPQIEAQIVELHELVLCARVEDGKVYRLNIRLDPPWVPPWIKPKKSE